MRLIPLLFILLLLPNLVSADPMKAVAMGQLLPLFGLLLVSGVVLLGGGLWLIVQDYYSLRENPRWRTVVILLISLLFGVFLTGVLHQLSPLTGPSFPNLFTEVVTPLAALLFSLKKLRTALGQLLQASWLASSSAWLLVMASGIAGLFVSSHTTLRGSTTRLLAYFFLSLLVWLLIARKFSPQVPKADKGVGGYTLWWVAFAGPGLAAVYTTSLHLLQTWVIPPTSSSSLYLSTELAEQGLKWVLGTVFGGLVMLVATRVTPHPLSDNVE